MTAPLLVLLSRIVLLSGLLIKPVNSAPVVVVSNTPNATNGGSPIYGNISGDPLLMQWKALLFSTSFQAEIQSVQLGLNLACSPTPCGYPRTVNVSIELYSVVGGLPANSIYTLPYQAVTLNAPQQLYTFGIPSWWLAPGQTYALILKSNQERDSAYKWGRTDTELPPTTSYGFSFQGAMTTNNYGVSWDIAGVTLDNALAVYATVVTTPGRPGAPTAEPGNGQALVTVAPPDLGGTPESYRVIAIPGDRSCIVTGPNGSCVVNGLTNGEAYIFSSTATNRAGTSQASSPSNVVIPSSLAPNLFAISPSSGSQSGGSRVVITGTNLTGASVVLFGQTPATSVTVNSANQITAVSPAQIGGAVNVTVVTPSGRAFLERGYNYDAPPSEPGTPISAPGDRQVSVSWSQIFSGGDPVSYTVTASPGSQTCTVPFPGQAFPYASCVVTGLTNGTAYTFQVQATNTLGSATSAASIAATPQAVLNGACGAANGVTTLVQPAGLLCGTGSPGVVTNTNGTFTWNCSGTNGGATAQCSAPGSPSQGSQSGSTAFTTDSATSGCNLQSARLLTPPDGGPGGGSTMPYGVVNFEMVSCTGNEARVRMTYADSIEGMQFWKYVVNNYHTGWTQMPANQVTLSGNTAEFTIVDNGEWDNDPTIGAIADPGGTGFAPTPPAPGNVALGGFLTGLRVASDLVLLNNGANPATFSQTGAFGFPGGIPTGSRYNVTVGTQPPGQTCSVTNGAGVANSTVNNLEVRCVNNLYRIGGTVTGLAAGQRLRLVNNGVESLVVSANGAFNFLQSAAWNGRYNVVVGTQPTTQTCTVTGGTGFNVRSNVTNILVRCSGETVVDGQTLPRSGLIYAPCGVSVLYQNMNYYTAPGRENIARIAICALTNARLTYPDFFNDRVTSKHELIGGLEVQGYARDYLATSYYGMVTLVQKTTGQTIAFQVTRPQPGPNNSGINVDFLDGSIGFTSHLTPPLPDLPNGRWTMWITRGGVSTEGWGTVPAIQLLPDVPRDLGNVGDALNPNVNSQDIDWSAVQ